MQHFSWGFRPLSSCFPFITLSSNSRRNQSFSSYSFSSVQSFSCVRLFATPWTAECKASLSITNSQSLRKLMSIEWVMPSDHLILCHPLHLVPLVFHSIRVFSKIQFFASGGQSIGASTSESVLPMTNQDWFPLGWTGLIFLQSKGLSRVFSSTTVWRHHFFSSQPSLWSNSHFSFIIHK